jgi:class 3 adenylate cyclase
MNVPLFEHEQFFIVRDGVLVDRQAAGTSMRWSDRAVHMSMTTSTAGGFVPVDVPAGATVTVYGHMSTGSRAATTDFLIVRLWDAERAFDGERRDRLLQGVFYGVMLFLVVYNLGLFLVVREPSFLYYVIMELGFAATWGTLMGLTWEYFSPNHPEWEFRYVWIGGTIGGFGGWQFIRHYLDMRRFFPRMDRLLAIVAWSNVAALPLIFLPIPEETLQAALFAAVPFAAVAVFAAIVLAVRNGHTSVLNLLAAMLCIVLGSSIFIFAVNGWLPMSDWTIHAGQIGSALAGIILSIGLGYRLQGERTRLARLKRFLSPKVSELIAAGQLDDPLATRRREVTIVFVDLRGFTAFSETAAPEDVLGVLRDYHGEIGRLVGKYDGTIEHFAGDGVMIIFNDPAPLPNPALNAVLMALDVRDAVERLAGEWRRRGYKLECGLGIAQGFATIGTIGFEGRFDYGTIGTVTNLAARLCGEAKPGQILISQRAFGNVEAHVNAEAAGELVLKGFSKPMATYSVKGRRVAKEVA